MVQEDVKIFCALKKDIETMVFKPNCEASGDDDSNMYFAYSIFGKL